MKASLFCVTATVPVKPILRQGLAIDCCIVSQVPPRQPGGCQSPDESTGLACRDKITAMIHLHYYPSTASMAPHIDIKAHAEVKVGLMLDQLDAELARQGTTYAHPWLLGANYSAVEMYTLMLCRWTRNFDSAPARNRAHLGLYLQRVLARPVVIRVMQAEGLAPPWV